MARPTKLTPDVQKRICEALRAGNTRKASAAFGGVDYATFAEWISRGEDRNRRKSNVEFAEFAEAVTRAESECEVENVAILKKAATGWETKTTRTKRWKEKVGEQFIQMEESVTTVGREFDWRASLEWLKRRRKDDWSERTETTGPDGGAVPVKVQFIPYAGPNTDNS